MTIRARLTVWYASILLASIFLMAGVLYYELVIERAWMNDAKDANEPMEIEIAEIIAFYGLPTALLTVVGGWCLLRKALAPLDKLTAAAERLHIHNLHEQLPRTGNGDEVDRLAEVLNATNNRLEDSFERIKEFSLHASHELKTPLAILHGEIEMSLGDPDATSAQREAYASQLDELQRLSKIVEGLALLAKADAGRINVAREPVRLDELVQDSFADLRILAQEKRIDVALHACENAIVSGDRHRLRQLLVNLTDNAIKFNQPDGRVTIALKRNGSLAELTIANTGEGIPAPMLHRVFDRFFRGDESHNREIDGCGLGLSISEWIVKAHGGEIVIASDVGAVTTVSVKLPMQS